MGDCSWENFFNPAEERGLLNKIIVGVDEIPGVINRDMIVDTFYETADPDYKQQQTKEEVNYEDITSLFLERKNVLKMDHLWMLENLTVLSLAHNSITVIENISELKNLVELNLSYNRIEQITGLEGLSKLEFITFNGNRIQVVSGLLDQENSLRILTLSRNDISDKSCIIYLNRFKKLVSLNLYENPVADTAFNERVIVFLSELVYYNNHYITEAERNDARASLQGELKEKAELEEARQRYLKKLYAYKNKLKFCERAFVDGLDKNEFFYKMFQKDPDGRAFRDDTDKFEDVYDRLKSICFDVSTKIFEAGASNIEQRLKEVKQFKQDTQINAQTGQKRLSQATAKISSRLNALLAKAKNYFKGPMTKLLKKDSESLKIWLEGLDMLREFVNHFLDDQWFVLMSVEMKNFEKNEETIATYDRSLAEVISVFSEEIQSQFTRLRDAQNDCHEEISNRLKKMMNEAYQRDELHKLPLSFQERMVDKETLSNAIDSSHDMHLLTIDMKEDSIISRLRKWHQSQTGDLMNNEMARNREVVLAIHKFINNQKKEFEQQICGILNCFKILEPDENFEENLDTIIKQWLTSKSYKLIVPTLDEPKRDSEDEGIFGSDIFSS